MWMKDLFRLKTYQQSVFLRETGVTQWDPDRILRAQGTEAAVKQQILYWHKPMAAF